MGIYGSVSPATIPPSCTLEPYPLTRAVSAVEPGVADCKRKPSGEVVVSEVAALRRTTSLPSSVQLLELQLQPPHECCCQCAMLLRACVCIYLQRSLAAVHS